MWVFRGRNRRANRRSKKRLEGGEDHEFSVAHIVFQEHHILPRDLYEMRIRDPAQYAFIYASVLVESENRRKQQKEIERNKPKTKGRR